MEGNGHTTLFKIGEQEPLLVVSNNNDQQRLLLPTNGQVIIEGGARF